jgi:hypothetical protein
MRLKWEKPELITFSCRDAGPGEETGFGQGCCLGSGEACDCIAGPGAMTGCDTGAAAIGCSTGNSPV